jgi:four helix bundle protein
VESEQKTAEAFAGRIVDFKDLIVWKKAMALAKKIYELTARFPAVERFGLASQMRRAAVSAPSNIAEGQGRRGPGEFPHFLAMARGSLAELETQLLLSAEVGFAKPPEVEQLAGDIREIQRMIAGIQRKLASRSSGE